MIEAPSAATTGRTSAGSAVVKGRFLSSSYSSSSRLYYSEGSRNRDEEQQRRNRERMSIVRSLQTSFYGSVSNTSTTPEAARLVLEEGTVTNLPLWQVNWLELPGRTNVWNVHQVRPSLRNVIREPT
jgi:hypothetical protein